MKIGNFVILKSKEKSTKILYQMHILVVITQFFMLIFSYLWVYLYLYSLLHSCFE